MLSDDGRVRTIDWTFHIVFRISYVALLRTGRQYIGYCTSWAGGEGEEAYKMATSIAKRWPLLADAAPKMSQCAWTSSKVALALH